MSNTNLCCCLWLNDQLRKLWSQHVYRTRFFTISTASELADLSYTTRWLLQNPGDFAAILEQFYGPALAGRFQTLLAEHLTIASELVNAAKNQETAKADSARKKWYENADEISQFLSEINRYWSRKKWTKMLYFHLKMTENQAALQLSGQYAEEIAEFDNIENEALEMADYMAAGIIRQFALR